MDKTQISLPIAMYETKKGLIDLINGSSLPLCIIQEILQNIMFEVQSKAKIELEKEYEQLNGSSPPSAVGKEG